MEQHAELVLKNEGKILFVKRSMKKKILPGMWEFPSGTMEKGERNYETIKREALEELGIEVEPKKIFMKKDLPEFLVSLIFVLCAIKNGEIQIKEPDEIDELK